MSAVSPHPFIPPEGRISFRERYLVKSGLDMTQWSTITSGMGQKLTLQSDRRMSALPPTADIHRDDDHVSFGPKAEVHPHYMRQFL
jgi:hypothetical protein